MILTSPSKSRQEYGLSPVQRSLLHAALLREQPALEAWQQWRTQVDIETLDPESHHLLSLLYPNLVRHHVEDPHMGRLKGVYRRTWYANQLLVQSLKLVLQGLQKVEANPLVLGEMALVAIGYSDYGHRPVYQLDVMVPRSQTLEAITSLEEMGWTTHSYKPQPGDRLWKPMPFWQDRSVQKAPDIHLNLHNHLFQAIPQHFTDEQLWINAVMAQISDLSVPVLSPVDQLLYLCLQRNQQRQRPFYWFADAAILINRMSQESDWVRLVSQAQRYEIILPLRYFLMELQAVLHLPIPDWVLPSLAKMAISYHELLEYHLLPDNKLLLLKARLVRLRQQWNGWFVSRRAGVL